MRVQILFFLLNSEPHAMQIKHLKTMCEGLMQKQAAKPAEIQRKGAKYF